MKASWQLISDRATSFVPPSPGGFELNYALAFDEHRGVLVYVRQPDFHQFGESWLSSRDGVWVREHDAVQIEVDQRWVGHYDAGRKGVACWSLERSYDQGGYRCAIRGLLVTEEGVSEIATSGDVAVDDESTPCKTRILFAYDPSNERTLAVTPYAVHALDADNTWQKIAETPDAFPGEWHKPKAACAVWDHGSNRLLIAVVDREDYQGKLFAFDGRQIEALTVQGLPQDVELYENNSTFALASSEQTGTVLVLGEPHGSFRLEGSRWEKVATTGAEPRRCNGVRAAVDHGDGSLWLGPGGYELEPGAYAKAQDIFYRFDGDQWALHGHLAMPSPTDWYGGVALAGAGGRLWIASKRNPLGLRVADENGWTELVGEEEASDALEGFGMAGASDIEVLAADGDGTLHAFSRDGAVFRFDDEKWTAVHEPDADTFKERVGFLVGWDAEHARFVAWGGKVKNRRSNHTFYLEKDGWKKEKKTSPKPSDFQHESVQPRLAYDPHEGTLVRFGFDGVHVLKEGVWEMHVPNGWEDARHGDPPIPAADPKTGEVLLVDLYAHTIHRFDYAQVEKIGDIEDHEFAIDPLERGTYAHVPRFVRDDQIAYDPDSRSIIGQAEDDAANRFRLPLADAFEAARQMGARTPYGALQGDAEAGASDTADSAAARLTVDDIREQLARPITTLELGEEVGKWDFQYVGGTPRGLPKESWPKLDGDHLGHLVSLPCAELFEETGSVCVFVPPNDLVMEEGCVTAVLTSAKQMSKDRVKAPEGAPVLPARALVDVELGAYELDVARTRPLEEADPLFASRLEEFHELHGTQETHFSKTRGAPNWVQSDEWPHDEDGNPWIFVGQVDFESLDTAFIEQAWPEVAMWGVLYVFVSPNEKEAAAFWQYT